MAYIGNDPSNRFVAPKAASVFSGDGSTTAFTLDHSVGSDEDILVSVDGVIQEPSVAYTVSGTTLSFTAAPSSNSGNNIFVYYLFRTVGTVSHPSNNALSATSGTFSGAITGGGTFTPGGNIVIPDAGSIGSVSDTDAIAISSGGVANFTQTPTINSLNIANTPSFLASRTSSNQSITASTWTKIQFNDEVLDTDNMYDHSTNYRFTPTVAGKYYIFTNVNSGNTNTHIYGALYFNGSALTSLTIDGSQGGGVYVGNVVTFNGSSDYIEAYTYQGTGTGAVEDAAQYSIFGGYRLIGV